MPNPNKRMTANPAKPVARYRPGKTVQEKSSSEEEQSEDDKERQQSTKQAQPKASSFPGGAQRRQPPPRQIRKDESEDEEGFVTEEEDDVNAGGVTVSSTTAKDGAPMPTRLIPAISRSRPELMAEESVSEDATEASEEESSSEEEESSSEEEVPQRKFQRPTFIKKSDRGKSTSVPNAPAPGGTNGIISTSPAPDTLEAEEARRKALADLMIKDKLERDAAARAAGRKGWDDDDEVAPEDMIDDTDGLDPEAEYAAWKLRELKRLKRDREAIEEREREIEEAERRRNLTQAEREAEDREYLGKQKEERDEGRGKAGFLQRYHHKGAFFQDDETAEILRKRDLMGVKFVDEVQNREALPQYMQVRDMTKLGKKGRTRYTDLRGEDTGKWGQGYDQRARKGQNTDLDIDERFRPDHDSGSRGATGANASTVRDRRDRRVEGAPEGPRAMRNAEDNGKHDVRGDSYQPPDRSLERDDDSKGRVRRRSRSPRRRRSYSKSRSRSASRDRHLHEDHDGRGRRKRSPSPYGERDKRRRIETI
jgi:microfibrillar-associated protein 1